MKKRHLQAAQRFVRSHKRELLMLVAATGIIGLCTLAIYKPAVKFSFSGQNCFKDITWLPNLYNSKSSSGFELTYDNQKSIKNFPILSTKTCIEPTKAPSGQSTASVGRHLANIPMLGKQFKVETDHLPKLKVETHKGKISVRESIKVRLDKEDRLFEYTVRTNDKEADCRSTGMQLACDVSTLSLDQNKSYSLSVHRKFKDQAHTKVLTESLQTTNPVTINRAPIENDAVVYDLPAQFSFETSRDLESVKVDIKMQAPDNKLKDVALRTTINGKSVQIIFNSPLERRANFVLSVNDVIATDRGVLLEPVKYSFSTSGGPKVRAANISTRSVEPGRDIVIAFDQGLKPDQDLANKVAVTVGSAAAPVKLSIVDSQLIVRPLSDWGLCTPFTVKITADLVSNFGLTGDSAWQISSRTICYRVVTLGYSVQGRPIQAWRFGSGATKVLYLGATHGDEQSTKLLMDEWIRELEANPARLPVDKTVIVIPVLNPDGYAAKRRQNANNVDLNRNFPTNDWKKDVTMPGGGAPVENGGGATPLSEPESQVLSSVIASERPSLVLTYHSVASVVTGNNIGSAPSFAQTYAQLSGYNNLPREATSNVFLYDTTGAFEDWLHDKVGIPALLVELGSSYRSEFGRNRNAMWAMIGG